MKLFRYIAVLILFAVPTLAQQPTPNIGLQIPATGSNNWYIPLNYNFTKLDLMLSGNSPLPALKVTGNVTIGGTVTANSFAGPSGSAFATATAANQYSPVFYNAVGSGTSLGGVSPFSGFLYYLASANPRPATTIDISNFLKSATGCNTIGTSYSPFSNTCIVSGGVPAGSATDVQLNGGSSFAADSGFFSYTTGTHTLATTNITNGVTFVSKLTNGGLNSDTFLTNPTSNDGVANALASSYCTSGACTVVRPPFSLDNTYILPLPPSADTILDYMNAGSITSHNPPAAHNYKPGTGYDCFGVETWGCRVFVFDTPNPTATNVDLNAGAVNTGAASFNKWSWNYGNAPNTGNTQWGPAGKGTSLFLSFNSQGITQAYSTTFTKHATGDGSLFYGYGYSDAGSPDYSAEGHNNMTLEGGETSDYFHGIVGAGATTGSISLPITYNSSFSPASINRNATSAGAYLIDITQGTINGHVTGVNQFPTNFSTVSVIPTDLTVTPSTAYGNAGCEMAVPVGSNPNLAGSITCNINNIGGSTGAFVVGPMEISGDFPEQTNITAVGTVSGGSQSITFTYVHPHGSSRTMIWQGSNVIGTFLNYDAMSAIAGFKSLIHIYGATDSSHIVAENFAGGVAPNPYFAPATVTNLTQSGSTVTAAVDNNNSFTAYNLMPGTISGCADSGFNQNVTNITQHLTAQTLTWTSPGTGVTCSSASLSLSNSYFAFHLYPGAAQLGPAISAPNNLPLEPNTVAWSAGDLIEMPHHFDWAGSDLKTVWSVNNPLARNSGNSRGVEHDFGGSGAGGQQIMFRLGNYNPCNYYIGCGGTMTLNAAITIGSGGNPYNGGINGGGLRLGEAPINGAAVISWGCQDVALGGCGNTDKILFAQSTASPNSQMYYYPDVSGWGVSYLISGLGSTTTRGYGGVTGGTFNINGYNDEGGNGVRFYGTNATLHNQLTICNHGTATFAISVGNCYDAFYVATSDGELDAGTLRADASSQLANITVGLSYPVKTPSGTYTGTAGSTTYSYQYSVVSPLGIEGPRGDGGNVNNAAATLNGSNYVTITCPTSLQPGYPAGSTYKLWGLYGGTYSLGTCPIGGTVVDNTTPSYSTQPSRLANEWALATQWQVMAGGSVGFWNSNISTGAMDSFINRLAANKIGFGSTSGASHDGTIEASTIIADTAFNGPATGLTAIPAANLSGTVPVASLPIAIVGTNGVSQPDNSTVSIDVTGKLSTKGFSGSCASTTTLTVVNGVITGCS